MTQDEALPLRARRRKGKGLTARAARAPAPPDAKRLPGWVSEERGRSRRTAGMRMIEKVRLVIGALLMAAALFALMSGPGFLSDQDSTAPLQELREALR